MLALVEFCLKFQRFQVTQMINCTKQMCLNITTLCFTVLSFSFPLFISYITVYYTS